MSSATWFSRVVRSITDDQWQQPGLGVWTVRELVGHTSRNCTLVIGLTTNEVCAAQTPFAFWEAALSGQRNELHDSIAEAAGPAADALGHDPAASIDRLIGKTIAFVENARDDHAVRFGPLGDFRVIDFLPSRIVEFIAHGLDVCRATGRSDADIPADAARLAAGWVAAFAEPATVVRLLLGRDGSSFNLFG